MPFQVTIANTEATIPCRSNQTVLQASVAAGLDYPYTCATGNCAACITKLTSGEVSLLPYSDNALTPAQRAEGQVLACRARPLSDLSVIWLGRGRQ
jgi:ferredoxin-NAD(P)+ reductase (naphthalene dioxygenase ferredoxin-specific)